MKRVVVSGANGYIGRHVVSELIQHRELFSVAAIDLEACTGSQCEFIPFNLLEDAGEDGLYESLGCPDICLHLAWRNGFQHNAVSHINDLPFHFTFLKNLADHGTKQFAVAGSFREYGRVNGMVNHDTLIAQDNFYSLAKSTLKRILEIYFEGKDICLQWLRPFTVYGDDEKNGSIMGKIIRWEREGKDSFPFTDGNEEYDYIRVDNLAKQIVAVISQTEVSGIIDCCSGQPTRLGDQIEAFLKENNFHIRPEYGAFPSREYDSPIIYGDRRKLDKILQKCSIYKGECI